MILDVSLHSADAFGMTTPTLRPTGEFSSSAPALVHVDIENVYRDMFTLLFVLTEECDLQVSGAGENSFLTWRAP